MKTTNHIAFLLFTIIALFAASCSNDPNPTYVSANESSSLPTEAKTEPAINATLSAHTITGKVIAVLDGDTIDLLDQNKQKIRIRFHGIDAPETGQPFGSNAKRFVSERIAAETVDVREYNLDRYDRTIGDILIDGQRLSVAIVKAGLAWHYVQYAPDDHELAAAELEARRANRGLWADKRHVAPWDWRRLSKTERDKLR